MNKYLRKIAELSDENKAVARTFLESSAVAVPAHLMGAYVGERLGSRLLKHPIHFGSVHLKGSNVGQFVGTSVLGGLADIAAFKHSLHGKINKE
jgi:hypothetical protein